MLLLPRSALNPPPDTITRILLQCNYASLLHIVSGASQPRSAPSILCTPKFDRWVVTHSLTDSNLHGHRPTVLIWTPLLRFLCSCLGCLSPCKVHPSLQIMLTTICPLVPLRCLFLQSKEQRPIPSLLTKSTSSIQDLPTKAPLSCETFRLEPATR